MRKNSPKTFLLCGLVFLLGLFLSILLYKYVDETNNARKEKLLDENFNNTSHRIQNVIDYNLGTLYSLRAYYLSKGGFTRDQFTKFGSFYTDVFQSIQALEWVPVVPLDERGQFEASTRQEGFEDFEIFTRTENGRIVRAGERPVYYPVHYIHPFEGNEAAFGFDPGKSLPVRFEVINKAIETKGAAASTVLEIIQKKDPHKAILVFVPIYNEENELQGFVEGVFLIDQLLNSSLQGVDIDSQFSLEITSNSGSGELLFQNDTNENKSTLFKSGDLQLADRTWNLKLTYSENSSTQAINPLWYFAGSMIFTFLLVQLVYNTLTDNRRNLIRNLKELRQKNEDLEQYAYVASHDLQEPLHSLQSLVSLIEDDYKEKFDQTGLQYLAYLRESSERMSLLIKNLLNYSRIGRMEDPKQVDCNQVVANVKTELSCLITESKAEILIKNDLPTIAAYPQALHQLFQNLISNGIKFQPPGQKPAVRISYESDGVFKVKDNGIGIPEDAQEKVFVIFKRLHNSSKYKGTGVGLANCKKIVDLHKGNIWIESEERKGSAFCFTLNLDK